jgi:hypothetical protein
VYSFDLSRCQLFQSLQLTMQNLMPLQGADLDLEMDLKDLAAQARTWNDKPLLALQHVTAETPLYIERWRTWPAARVAYFANAVAASVNVRDRLPAGERQDCQLDNLLVDTWRERGSESVPDVPMARHPSLRFSPAHSVTTIDSIKGYGLTRQA